eukprot:scaffold3282_cov198-Alexandrium_tamarense.AAC.27
MLIGRLVSQRYGFSMCPVKSRCNRKRKPKSDASAVHHRLLHPVSVVSVRCGVRCGVVAFVVLGERFP